METIGGDLSQMQRTPLAAAHVEALRAAGEVRTYPAGTLLVRPGEPIDRFVYVEEGEIEVVNPYTNERHFPSTLGPTQLIRGISFLNGGACSVPIAPSPSRRALAMPPGLALTRQQPIPHGIDCSVTVVSTPR